ncbi:MAG: methionyl-tRNA formyltransferase [Cyanobacteria bacterium P01_A01_bin.84]
MQFILVGAVDSTAIALEKLVEHNVPPVALFTLPLSKSQRHSDFVHLQPLAQKYGVPVVEVSNINSPDALSKIRFLQPDYLFVIGWSQICHQELLSIPRIGSIGCHPAPIPENRGRGVIPWTILQRRRDTAMTLFWLDKGVDSGDILIQEKFPVADDETATTLCEKHNEFLIKMFSEVIPLLKQGEGQRIKQNHHEATYCAKRGPDDGLIDWNLSADSIWTLIRAVTKPYPGAFSFYQGKKITIWEADYIGDAPYWGLPGQVQSVTDRGVVVQCGDGKHILMKVVQLEEEPEINANLVLKNHRKLGMNLLDLYQKIIETGCIE